MWKYYLSRNYYVWLISSLIVLPILFLLALINALKDAFIEVCDELKYIKLSKARWGHVERQQKRNFNRK